MPRLTGASQRLVHPSPTVWGCPIHHSLAAACPHFLAGLCMRSARVLKSGILLLSMFGVMTEEVTPKTLTRFFCHQVYGSPTPHSVLCGLSSPLPAMAPPAMAPPAPPRMPGLSPALLRLFRRRRRRRRRRALCGALPSRLSLSALISHCFDFLSVTECFDIK